MYNPSWPVSDRLLSHSASTLPNPLIERTGRTIGRVALVSVAPGPCAVKPGACLRCLGVPRPPQPLYSTHMHSLGTIQSDQHGTSNGSSLTGSCDTAPIHPASDTANPTAKRRCIRVIQLTRVASRPLSVIQQIQLIQLYSYTAYTVYSSLHPPSDSATGTGRGPGVAGRSAGTGHRRAAKGAALSSTVALQCRPSAGTGWKRALECRPKSRQLPPFHSRITPRWLRIAPGWPSEVMAW